MLFRHMERDLAETGGRKGNGPPGRKLPLSGCLHHFSFLSESAGPPLHSGKPLKTPLVSDDPTEPFSTFHVFSSWLCCHTRSSWTHRLMPSVYHLPSTVTAPPPWRDEEETTIHRIASSGPREMRVSCAGPLLAHCLHTSPALAREDRKGCMCMNAVSRAPPSPRCVKMTFSCFRR